MKSLHSEVLESVEKRHKGRFSTPCIEIETYNALMQAYSENRGVIDRDPYLLSELLVEDRYLLSEPPVDVVICSVER
jgi:hypothetical protein